MCKYIVNVQLKTKTTKTADGFFKENKKTEKGEDQTEQPGIAARKADQKAVDTAVRPSHSV